jgi:peptidoglycan/LPS O-acetylase OafA/YrhL
MKRPAHFRDDIQGLRGIAVLLVVLFHAWPAAVPGGFVGVDVFFVISGYLITGLLLREFEATGRIDLPAFYARRVRRLVPAAALVIATVVVVAPIVYSPLEVRAFGPTAIAAAAYVSNVWFAALSVDYLQEGLHQNLLLHTWSLGVEEQFYLVWPVLLLATARCLSRRAVGGVVAGVSALSLVACIVLTAVLQSWAFFSLPARAWELGVGASAVLLEPRARALGRRTRRGMAWTGLGCVLIAALLFSGRTSFPGYAALIPVVGAFLIVLAGAGTDARDLLAGTLQFAPLRRLGDVSYSLYLWHWPALIVVAHLWRTGDRVLVACAGVAVSLLLAALTYHFVENRARHHPLLSARPAKTIAAGLALMLATAGLAGADLVAAMRNQDAEARRQAERAARDRPRLYDDRCFAAALDVAPPDCLYGSRAARHTVALIGDSHAAQWFPALERLAQSNGWRLAVFVKAACPLAAVETFDAKLNRKYVECTEWRERVLERIGQLRPTLVVAGNSAFYDPFISRDGEAMKQWQRGLEASLRRLTPVAGHIALIRDTPRPGFHVPGCLARKWSRGGQPAPACTFRLAESLLGEAFEVERAAAATTSGVAVIDLTPSICGSALCAVERDGVVLFHDSQHISATLARSLADALWLQLPAVARTALAK